jgi:DMSO reductase anchor subunit
MNPAFSVILLTTLIGAGQGLFVALYAVDLAAGLGLVGMPDRLGFFVAGSALVVVLTVLGLVASFFHLGRPERAWRSAAMWRTSWLSREVIALPGFIAAVMLYGAAHWLGWQATPLIGAIGLVMCLALFACTGMVYACIKFLQEWSTPLTLVNYFVLGMASGFTLAAAFSVVAAPDLVPAYVVAAAVLTLVGLVTRSASLVRNRRLRPKSTLQSAIGIRHPRIVQKSQGFMGGSFNTREFFHRQSKAFLRGIKWGFLTLAFVVPFILLLSAVMRPYGAVLGIAFIVQYIGLLAERWFFLAQANHPQNLYYQTIS